MALSKEIIEATEYAKSQLMSSSLDETCKKQLHNLLTVSMMATNGISVDEKIQKITECISGIAILQLTFLEQVDKKIEKANREQCKSCKAMAHANDVEDAKKKEDIIEQWKEANGIKDDEDESEKTWTQIAKELILKPYVWIITGILVIAPNGVDIIKLLIDSFSK